MNKKLAFALLCTFASPIAHAMNPLQAAIQANDLNGVNAALGAGADPNAMATGGNTALHDAICLNVNPAILTTLIENGANPDAAMVQCGTTPILLAAMLGRAEQVEALLEAGADAELRQRGPGRCNALEICSHFPNTERVIRLLMAKGIALPACPATGRSRSQDRVRKGAKHARTRY